MVISLNYDVVVVVFTLLNSSSFADDEGDDCIILESAVVASLWNSRVLTNGDLISSSHCLSISLAGATLSCIIDVSAASGEGCSFLDSSRVLAILNGDTLGRGSLLGRFKRVCFGGDLRAEEQAEAAE